MRFLKLILFLFLSQTLVKAQVIKWQADRPLAWADFKGKADERGGTAAVIYHNIIYTYNAELRDSVYVVTFNIENIFDASSSWVQWRSARNEYLLGHEQLHFDIGELYTRKLAAAFHSAVYTSNYKAEIEAIYSKTRAEWRAMEAKYDAETRHSRDGNMQYRWQLFIYLELKNLPRNY